MAFRNPMISIPPRGRLLIPVVATLIVLIVLIGVFTSVYTDFLFYKEVDFTKVFAIKLRTEILMFFVVGLIVSVVVCGNAVIAYQVRPPFRPASLEQQNLDRYRLAIQPRLRTLLVLLGGVLTLFAGLAGQARWSTFLLWRHGQHFGQVDPQFHRDISYFLFTYPMQRLALGVAFTTIALAIVASALVHYLYGGIRLQTPGDKAVPAAKAHLSVLLGVFVLLKAVAYYLDRFGLTYSHRGFVDTGASYTDVHAVLPAKEILLVIAVVCALLFFANIRLRGWLLPGVSVGLLVLAALIVGTIVPAFYQHFLVKPNEQAKESAYISDNIKETRFAYGLTNVNSSPYNPSNGVVATAQADAANLSNIRLLDPNRVSPTFDQLQQLRSFYSFPETLDIDRYDINGKLQDFVVAAREVNLAGLQANQQNWINEHLAYTHGNGLVAAPANTVGTTSGNAGVPVFSQGEQDLPPTGVLNLSADGSRIYYGENSPPYSIVDTKQKEVDGPQATNTYDGSGGVKVSGVRRLLYALRFKDPNFILSSAITSNSRVQYYRDPRTRVQKVAPWLTLDGDPYPTVVKGRVTWVLDGYTTSDLFPYSARRTLGDVTADTTNTQAGANNAQQAQDEVNYIRNSVKATVDADTGQVTLYAWTSAGMPLDPILKTWMSIFPGTVQPQSAIPAELLAHIRYPEDLFKVQRDLLAEYHVTDPNTFYKGSDFWAVPNDPSNNSEAQPPFYVVSQVPGQKEPSYNLTTTFVPQGGRQTLSAFLSVSSGSLPGVTDPRAAYGAFTLLAVPTDVTTDGVTQAQNRFNSFAGFSRDRTQFDQNGSAVINGNLLSIPTGGGVLYVEPIYLTGTANGSLPVLVKVLTSYNSGNIGYDNTLAGALAQTFGTAPQATTTSTPTPNPTTSASPSPSASSTPTVVPSGLPSGLPTSVAGVASALQAALAAQQQAAAAGAYTVAQADQTRVNALIAQLGRLTASAVPSAAPSGASAAPSGSGAPSGSAPSASAGASAAPSAAPSATATP